MDWESAWGAAHVATALLALVVGAGVLSLPKGTSTHRRLGRVYVAAMLVLNGSALSLHRSDEFGVFHLLAVASLATLAAALVPMVVGRRTAAVVARHGHFMAWSYVGLVAAGCGQLAAGLASASPWSVPLVIGTVLGVGGAITMTRVPKSLRHRTTP